MSTEPTFLSFKGLKQYTPEQGWEQVNALLQETHAAQVHLLHDAAPDSQDIPDNVPTLTQPHDSSATQTSPVIDPLIQELFQQLREPPSHDLSQTWRTIADKVNVLTQDMNLRRELNEHMQKLDQEISDLRGSVMSLLADVRRAADQQLSSARVRAEVSALAQTKLAEKLSQKK